MKDAIEKIEEFKKFGSVLGLERMEVLLGKLGNPEKDLKVIHVAGTNGKGSICKYIYEALIANGYSVGLFTSPFIEIFNERIEMDGKYITDEELDNYSKFVLEKTEDMVAEGYQSPTEFEVITALMFLYFKEKNPDYVILEVGLGGRGDSTNVIENPIVSVIASISFDHTDRLGDTLGKIAFEKAGIIKENVPVVVSATEEEALETIRRVADEKHAFLIETRDTKYGVISEELTGYTFKAMILGKEYENVKISMLGKHQIENAICALTTLNVLEEVEDLELNDEKTLKGLELATQKGRFEVLCKRPLIILDGAHNPDGARSLKDTVQNHFAGKKILMITGILKDKDVNSILENFKAITNNFIITEPDNPRKMPAEELKSILGEGCKAFSNYELALEEAIKQNGNYDLILISGSLYLIGAIRKKIREKYLND